MNLKNDILVDLELGRQVVGGDASEPCTETGAESSAENRELRRGDLCPQCKQEHLDYDGLLNLSCAHCGYALGGCFT